MHSRGETVALAAVDANVCKLCQLQTSSEGLTALAELDTDEWRTLLDVAERSFHTPGSRLFERVLSVVHSVVTAEVQAPRCNAALENGFGTEAGIAAELLCDYLDLILVPSTLRRPSLREDAVRCPCERCLGAAQALQRIQHSVPLRILMEASVLRLLCVALEQLPVAVGDIAQGVAECLAVFATSARLQENHRFDIPLRTVHAVLMRLQSASPFANARSPRDSAFGDFNDSSWSSGELLVRVVHILRNVTSNHNEVLAASADVMAACGRGISAAIEVSGQQALSDSQPKANPGSRKRHGVGDRAPTARREEAIATESMDPHVGFGGDLQPVSPSPLTTSSAASACSARASPAVFDSGNPQESDEGLSGAEFGALKETYPPKQTVAESQHIAEVDDSRQRSPSPERSRALSLARSQDLQQRCAEQLALFSLALQALYQTDEALRQPGVFASEEAVRWQIVTLVQQFRVGGPLTPKWRERLAFHGLRLYLLLSRSSHKRRQYVVLQRQFVEEEQRMVAFLLSLTPASQQCCVLLRAMVQDVHSWLAWQAQAPPTATTARAIGPPQPARNSLLQRPRRRRLEKHEGTLEDYSGKHKHKDAGSSSAHRKPDSVDAIAQGPNAQGTQPVDNEEFEDPCLTEEPTSLTRIFSPDRGEAVWLVHGLLLLAFVLFLLFVWHSLEHPRVGVSNKRAWKYEI